uniref:Uncharacterized protein n=1 Tax=Cacopsylla melanoneura TaxID=428564 RepID=A0A8D8QFG5_9HEMI
MQAGLEIPRDPYTLPFTRFCYQAARREFRLCFCVLNQQNVFYTTLTLEHIMKNVLEHKTRNILYRRQKTKVGAMAKRTRGKGRVLTLLSGQHFSTFSFVSGQIRVWQSRSFRVESMHDFETPPKEATFVG